MLCCEEIKIVVEKEERNEQGTDAGSDVIRRYNSGAARQESVELTVTTVDGKF